MRSRDPSGCSHAWRTCEIDIVVSGTQLSHLAAYIPYKSTRYSQLWWTRRSLGVLNDATKRGSSCITVIRRQFTWFSRTIHSFFPALRSMSRRRWGKKDAADRLKSLRLFSCTFRYSCMLFARYLCRPNLSPVSLTSVYTMRYLFYSRICYTSSIVSRAYICHACMYALFVGHGVRAHTNHIIFIVYIVSGVWKACRSISSLIRCWFLKMAVWLWIIKVLYPRLYNSITRETLIIRYLSTNIYYMCFHLLNHFSSGTNIINVYIWKFFDKV